MQVRSLSNRNTILNLNFKSLEPTESSNPTLGNNNEINDEGN